MEYYDLKIRIPYADVDQMGVVYYANYLVYFERGRTEFLRAIGIEYSRIEKDYQLFLPVKEASLTYLSPSKYDENITVRTYIDEVKRASMIFYYEIFKNEGKILVNGKTHHVFINSEWKPTRIPEHVAKAMSSHIKNCKN